MEERRSWMFVGGRLKGSMIEAAVRRFSNPRDGRRTADTDPAPADAALKFPAPCRKMKNDPGRRSRSGSFVSGSP